MAGPQPFIVRWLVGTVGDPSADLSWGLVGVGSLLATTMAYVLVINWKFHHLVLNGIRIRAVLLDLLYEKALRLRLGAGGSGDESRGEKEGKEGKEGGKGGTEGNGGKDGNNGSGSVGDAMNLMSNDTELVFESHM